MKALEQLHSRGLFHIVADVVLMGGPLSTTWTDYAGARRVLTSKKQRWERARAVVSGRFVNCFSRKDWVLAALYRYMEMGICVAGLGEVTVDGVQNVDCSDIISGHEEY